jgi:hypothetical protein
MLRAFGEQRNMPSYSGAKGSQGKKPTSINFPWIFLCLMSLAVTGGCSNLGPVSGLFGSASPQAPVVGASPGGPSSPAQSYHDATRIDRQMNRGN